MRSTIIALLATFFAASVYGASATGRATAFASANVSITIPAISAFQVSASGAAGTRLSMLPTGADAVVLRSTSSSSEVEVVSNHLGGWNTIEDGSKQLKRGAGVARTEDVTYELWSF